MATPVRPMRFHKIAALLPLMSAEELAELASDIKEHGLRNPILTHEGQIIDGRNRFLACRQAGVKPRFEGWEGGGSLVAFVLSMNVKRRHLTSGQKAAVAVEALPCLEAEAAARQRATRAVPGEKVGTKASEKVHSPSAADRNEGRAAAQAARMTGSNAKYVAEAKKVKEEDPAQFEDLKQNKTTLAEIVRKRREKQREARRQENRQKVAAAPSVDLLTADARFATIVIDPPWDWNDEGDDNQLGRAQPDYATMPLQDLLNLPVAKLADTDCHLYLWITNRSLPKGFQLLDRWGFRYITAITWVKPSMGMGNYFRGQTEHVLFAIRGSQQLKRRDVGTVFYANRGRRHGEKPNEFFELVESCSPGPYLEMFSRTPRRDWISWGENDAAA